MGDKVSSSTNKPATSTTAAQTNDVNPFLTAPVPKSKQEAVETQHSQKGAKQHATQMKEHKKMEASVRQAEVQQDYSNWFNDADKLDPGSVPDRTKMYHPAAIPPYQEKKLPSVNETRETGIVDAKKGAGHLVPLKDGKPDRPMTVTVHGIAASPDTVRPLSNRAAKAGDAVKTFAYDDTGRTLKQSSTELANEMGRWLKENPGRPLRIDAHSMGGRIALDAVDQLNKKGLLKGRQVELNLVASPINGGGALETSAFIASKTPVVGGLTAIPYIKQGPEMARPSDFQKGLDQIKFPPNVKVRVFTGGEDGKVDRDEKFDAMCKQLNAERVHFPKADHDTAVDEAAKWLSKHNRP
ncbi:alpha/beta hydrolase [bacterium]|nr:alpha/beta hydrolase [bacterium]